MNLNTIDIDVGGTFTDCYVRWGDRAILKKAPTTAYDLSRGVLAAIKAVAEETATPLEDLLSQIDLVRYSTTVALNSLLQRKGPKLGLITNAGFEDTIYIGKGSQWQDGMPQDYRRNLAGIEKPEPLIPRELVVGARCRIDSAGREVMPVSDEDILEKVQYLVDQGVRGIVVSLLWSHLNPAHERKILRIIELEYPDYYLGSVPVFLCSQVHPKRFEYTRTIVTILHAYVYFSMGDEIGQIRNEMRDHGYSGPLLMIHSTGGVAQSHQTAPLHTYNGGPVAGLVGAAHLARLYGYKDAVITDMGGTSFDLGIVTGGSYGAYWGAPTIDRWQVDLPILDCKSIGAGGGSIAGVNPDLADRIEVGPESAGSDPGPACYDQGGTRPTVTDADLVLGYLNAGYFSGGARTLNLDRAKRAIRQRVAGPLGVTVEDAALLIKRVIDAKMGHEIFKETVLKGRDPREFVLFAIGGGGGLHGAGFGEVVGIKKILTFPFSSVFCAYSGTYLDVVHMYEKSLRFPLRHPQTADYHTGWRPFNDLVGELREMAVRDMAGEGFAPEQIVFQLELDMKYGGQLNILRCASPRLSIERLADAEAIYGEFEKYYADRYSAMSVFPQGGVDIENFVLKAGVVTEKPVLPSYAETGPDPAPALKSRRDASWPKPDASGGEWVGTPIYERDKLGPGNRFAGPAIIESPSTNYLVPPGWVFSVDRHLTGILEPGALEPVVGGA